MANRNSLYARIVELASAICAIFAILPVLFAAIVSFMPAKDLYTQKLVLLPSELFLGNYETAFHRAAMFRYFLNSFLIASVCSVSRILFGTMAAYGFCFFEFKGKKFAFFLVLCTALVPQEILFTQNYLTVSGLGLVNRYLGVCSVFLSSAFPVFVFYLLFTRFPRELKDAAEIDGCGHRAFYFWILLPTNLTAIVAVAFTSFVSLWNMYLWPLVITNANEMRTVQVGITMLKGRDSPDFAPVMAASTVSVIPAIILFLLSRKLSKNNFFGTNSTG